MLLNPFIFFYLLFFYHNSIHRRMDFCTLRFCLCLNIHIKTTIIKGKITLCYISQRICERESGCVSCYGFLYFCLTGSCLFLICLPISECDRFLAEFFNFDLNPAILTAPGSQIVLRVKNICPFQYRCWCYRRNRRWGRCGCSCRCRCYSGNSFQCRDCFCFSLFSVHILSVLEQQSICQHKQDKQDNYNYQKFYKSFFLFIPFLFPIVCYRQICISSSVSCSLLSDGQTPYSFPSQQ